MFGSLVSSASSGARSPPFFLALVSSRDAGHSRRRRQSSPRGFVLEISAEMLHRRCRRARSTGAAPPFGGIDSDGAALKLPCASTAIWEAGN
jgi:hypothetical protein